MLKLKIILFCIIISLLEISCAHKNNINLKLKAIYVEDTILFQRFSFKIQANNQGNLTVKYSFKRQTEGVIGVSDENENYNTVIYLNDTIRKSACELLLSPLYPKELEIQGKRHTDLTFFSKCPDLLIDKNNSSDSLIPVEKLKEKFKNCQLYLVQIKNENNTADSIPIEIEKDFNVHLSKIHPGE